MLQVTDDEFNAAELRTVIQRCVSIACQQNKMTDAQKRKYFVSCKYSVIAKLLHVLSKIPTFYPKLIESSTITLLYLYVFSLQQLKKTSYKE